MASPNVAALNDINFDSEVLSSSLPVLVDFSAVWCGPCKRLEPIIDEIANEYVGKIKVGKLDVDESPLATQRHGVTAMPTLMVFKDGVVVETSLGLVNKAKILALLGL